MKFELWIYTDNAAFDSPPNIEVARILRGIANGLDAGEDYLFYETLRDINGNDVGRAKFIEEESK